MTTIRRAIPVIEKLFLVALAAIVLAVFVYVILARHAHAHAQTSICPPGTICTSDSVNAYVTSASSSAEPDYTLVIRTKLKQTVLVRGIRGNDGSTISKRPKDACEDVATTLRRSGDIESAECFQ